MALASDRQGCSPSPLQAAGTWQGPPRWGFLACSQNPLSLGNIKGFLQVQSSSFCVPALMSFVVSQFCLLPWIQGRSEKDNRETFPQLSSRRDTRLGISRVRRALTETNLTVYKRFNLDKGVKRLSWSFYIHQWLGRVLWGYCPPHSPVFKLQSMMGPHPAFAIVWPSPVRTHTTTPIKGLRHPSSRRPWGGKRS